jgi:hypothetical protein
MKPLLRYVSILATKFLFRSYCKILALRDRLNSLLCSLIPTNELAAIVPDAATPGIPMPGKVLSPHI